MARSARFMLPFLVLGGACSLTSLDGLTGDDGRVDGGVDVTRLDAAGTDGATDSSVNAFCARQDAGYRICADFDPPHGTVTEGFDDGLVPVPGGAGGAFDFDTTVFSSPTRGARGVANPFGPGGTTGVRLLATLWPHGPTPSSLHCSIAWSPQKLSTVASDYAHVVQVAVFATGDKSNQLASLSFNMHADGKLVFHEDYPDSSRNMDTVVPKTVVAGTWIPIDIVITPSSARFVVGGVATSVLALSVMLPATSHGALSIGPAYYAGATTTASAGWTFVYDDVVCR